MKNILGILLLITSCSSKVNKQIKATPIETTVNTVGERMAIPFEPDSLNSGSNVAHYLIEKFSKEYDGLRDKDIIGVKLIDSANVKNFGNAQVYNIKLSADLPEVFTKSNYLIINKNGVSSQYP